MRAPFVVAVGQRQNAVVVVDSGDCLRESLGEAAAALDLYRQGVR